MDFTKGFIKEKILVRRVIIRVSVYFCHFEENKIIMTTWKYLYIMC
jgi:hypothetical protein